MPGPPIGYSFYFNILSYGLFAKPLNVVVQSLLNYLNGPVPAFYFVYSGFFAFQGFVYPEKVGHFLKDMAGQFGNIFVAVIGRVVRGDRMSFSKPDLGEGRS